MNPGQLRTAEPISPSIKLSRLGSEVVELMADTGAEMTSAVGAHQLGRRSFNSCGSIGSLTIWTGSADVKVQLDP